MRSVNVAIDPPAAPRRGWFRGWNVVAACVLAQVAANGLPLNTFSLFLRDWAQEFHVPISTFHLSLGALVLGSCILSPIVGALADRWPARLIFGSGILCIAAFALAVSMAGTAFQVVLLYSLLYPVGLALSANVPSNAVVARWFVRRRGLAMGITAFGLAVAGMILPPLIAWLMPLYGWRAVWRATALAIVVAILPAVLLLIRDRPDAAEHAVEATGVAMPHGSERASAVEAALGWREIVSRPAFWILAAGFLPMLAVYSAGQQNLGPIVAAKGLDRTAAGLLLSLFSGAHVGSALLVGYLSDRIGNRLPMAMLAMLGAVGVLALVLGSGMPVLIGATILVGAIGGFWPLLASAAANEFGAAAAGRAFGLLTLFVILVSLVPFFVARLQEATGSYLPSMATLATLSVVGGAIILLLRERRRSGGAA